MPASRRRVLTTAAEVPRHVIDEIVEDMAQRMHRSEPARRCSGLSFTFRVTDRRLPVYRYAVGDGGAVMLTRDDPTPSTFAFTGEVRIFDQVLRGHVNPLRALLGGTVHLHGSLWHIRQLLRMMPEVERAYTASRQAAVERHLERYEFRF